MGAILKKQIQG